MELKLVPVKDVKPNPENRNIHPKSQIDDLVKAMLADKFRFPITISNQTGLLVSGHARLKAAKKAGLTEIWALFQDFDDADQEWRVAIADNGFAQQSKLDLPKIHIDLPNKAPFELEIMGIKNFGFEPIQDLNDFPQTPEGLEMITCPHCNTKFEKSQAKSKII